MLTEIKNIKKTLIIKQMEKETYIKTGLIPSAFSLPINHIKINNKIYFDFDLLNKEYNKYIKQLKLIEHGNNR